MGMVFLALLGLGSGAFGQGPDSNYVRIYQMIQDADTLRNGGQTTQAAERYRQAHEALTRFHEENPSWHENIVQFRLNYIVSRLEPLGGLSVKTNAPPAVAAAAAPASPAPATAAAVPNPVTPEQIKSLQDEIERLNANNAVLEEKLKEAWSAHPTALNPDALQKAEAQLRQVAKERDLLQITLTQHQAAPPPLPTTPVAPNQDLAALLAQERAVLEDVRRQLAEQTQRNTELTQENQTLKTQVATLLSAKPVTPLPDNDLARQYTEAQALIESLRATNNALRADQLLLEMRLADMTKASLSEASPDRIKTLESELRLSRADLKELKKEYAKLEKQLASANRRLEKKTAADVEKELSQVQARLAVLEASAVPLTPEELALTKFRSDIKVAVTNDAPTTAKKSAELPPGTGALMAQAERAIEQSRFDEAEKKLGDILLQDPNNVYTLSRLAGVLLDQSKTKEAEDVLSRALSKSPQDPSSNFLMGLLKYRQEQYPEALQALSLSAKANPEKAETQYFLGLTLIQQGSRGPAETALRKAIQLRPGWGDAHYELAVVYATQKPPFMELAQWHYQKAIGGGTPRNLNLEKLIESGEATAKAQ